MLSSSRPLRLEDLYVRLATSSYYTIGEVELKEDGIKAGKKKASGLFQAIQAYLLANPDSC